MSQSISLSSYGITVSSVKQNASPASLYEDGVLKDGSVIVASGAIATDSGAKKGRSPKDKRIVQEPSSEGDIWWGSVNVPFSEESFTKNKQIAIDYLNTCKQLYVVDGFGGWDPDSRIKVRIICSRPYHALFMHNMLIRPTAEELSSFGDPDYVVFNGGGQQADPSVEGVESETSVALNFASGEFVILGTQYAGEMKKGIFTVMNYLMPKAGVMSMHC